MINLSTDQNFPEFASLNLCMLPIFLLETEFIFPNDAIMS